jgi:hypothetical protein
MPQGE